MPPPFHARHLAQTVAVISFLLWVNTTSATQTAQNRWTAKARLDAIRRAGIWTETDIPMMNVKAGPRGPFAYDHEETVECDYAQRPRGIGSTLKFRCALSTGHQLKVRYGVHNGEVYGQIAATRLLWALGFGANRMYPVKVVCRGCASDPWDQGAASQATTMFDPATIDEKMAGTTLELKVDEGWSWKELNLVSTEAGGAPELQRDALKLLAVLIQHGSNKSPNQRILCVDEQADHEAPNSDSAVCAHPLMMLTDVGKTFGRANAFDKATVSSVNFSEWSRMPVWKESTSGCVGNLPRSWTGTLDHPLIGEPGRAFLANLLSQLTDSQLHDIFEVARFTRRDPGATVDDWVNAFKRKRAEIVNRRC
jgi:hypothetical protein